MINSVCVFCGSSEGDDPDFREAAQLIGGLLATNGLTLIYGGGGIGLMGTVADAVLDAGGKAIGVIPQSLAEKELAHDRLTELHVVDSMHQPPAEVQAKDRVQTAANRFQPALLFLDFGNLLLQDRVVLYRNGDHLLQVQAQPFCDGNGLSFGWQVSRLGRPEPFQQLSSGLSRRGLR